MLRRLCARLREASLVLVDICLTYLTKLINGNSSTARDCRIAASTLIDVRGSRAHRIWKTKAKFVHIMSAYTRSRRQITRSWTNKIYKPVFSLKLAEWARSIKTPHRKRIGLCKYMLTNIGRKVLEYGEDASKVRVYFRKSLSWSAQGGEHLYTMI